MARDRKQQAFPVPVDNAADVLRLRGNRVRVSKGSLRVRPVLAQVSTWCVSQSGYARHSGQVGLFRSAVLRAALRSYRNKRPLPARTGPRCASPARFPGQCNRSEPTGSAGTLPTHRPAAAQNSGRTRRKHQKRRSPFRPITGFRVSGQRCSAAFALLPFIHRAAFWRRCLDASVNLVIWTNRTGCRAGCRAGCRLGDQLRKMAPLRHCLRVSKRSDALR